MSATHVFAGFTLAAAVVQGAIIIAFPIPPIEVHSLEYRNGKVYQDRTVTAKEDLFPARFRAAINHAATDKPVAGCRGTDFWDYKTGRVAVGIPLPEWVNAPGCTVNYLCMIGGSFYPAASWHWGNDGTPVKIGSVFKPDC